FGYHKDYLSKVFNNRIGCGFNRYVNLLRARHARHLIATSRKSLDEISLLSGFQCMKSFRRAFLEYYGKTPYEYRSEIYEKPI
ncbi:MAG: helix-turn-helix domain-containing protein, partial [Clostridia bacterium]|nr:helix-turn-helix domain-containing protein [Clostridia bacterium]